MELGRELSCAVLIIITPSLINVEDRSRCNEAATCQVIQWLNSFKKLHFNTYQQNKYLRKLSWTLFCIQSIFLLYMASRRVYIAIIIQLIQGCSCIDKA